MAIDSHTHIYLKDFDGDREEMIRRSKEAGISRLLLPNIDSDSVDALHAVCKAYPAYCLPMMGLHPCSVQDDGSDELEKVKNLLKSGTYIAVGEIGLDLYWRKDNLRQQKESLRVQFDLALEYDLPVVMHCRDANKELLGMLEEYRGTDLDGVWHCFTGTVEEGLKATKLGYYLGVGGVLTYKKAGLENVFSHLPKEKLILETDAPYLSPIPKRGKRNEPSFMVHTMQRLAEVLQLPVEEIDELTSRNTERLFRLESFS